MWKTQKGRCRICNVKGDVKEVGYNSKVSLVIDHNHKTGAVRGLLCGPCNLGLGQFRDSTEYLMNAKEYLEYAVPKKKQTIIEKVINFIKKKWRNE